MITQTTPNTPNTPSAANKRTFAYVDCLRRLTIKRQHRAKVGQRYELDHISRASEKRLARVLSSSAFEMTVEISDDFTPTVYFFSKAAR